jgi:hypothetical protein
VEKSIKEEKVQIGLQSHLRGGGGGGGGEGRTRTRTRIETHIKIEF